MHVFWSARPFRPVKSLPHNRKVLYTWAALSRKNPSRRLVETLMTRYNLNLSVKMVSTTFSDSKTRRKRRNSMVCRPDGAYGNHLWYLPHQPKIPALYSAAILYLDYPRRLDYRLILCYARIYQCIVHKNLKLLIFYRMLSLFLLFLFPMCSLVGKGRSWLTCAFRHLFPTHRTHP